MALEEQQYQILKAKDTRALGKSLLIIPQLRVLMLTKRHVGSRNEIDSSSNVIPVKLFLGMVPSSSADITRVLSECFREGSIYIICMLFRFVSKQRKTSSAAGMTSLKF